MGEPTTWWLEPTVEVRPSAIAGRGLFASRPLPARTVVVRLGGRRVSGAELRRLIEESDDYVDSITVSDDEHLVLPQGNLVHFGNHSCDPNLWHDGTFSLATRRDVAAGEELTVDYTTQTADPEWAMACTCGATLCRGLVTGDDWRRPDLQQRYGDHFVAGLLVRIAGQR
ncbi:MAG TPA: SET domain-containing protein-lysine N-methyltransferase [Acidimicrobiales bacterium]|nr:SET domain-containing protein-lysine N-methyltransferase [Acidimicrobiales bacterium]